MLVFLCAALLQGGPVERFVLDNGLTVLLAEDHRAPLVSVGVMYAVGARNEAAGITGLAHYAEHMNFRATASFPGTEITEAITRIGGRWNGYTWIDQTWYVETVHKGAFEKMLDLERDRMTSALYDPEDFRKERTSVIAELHSYDDPHSVLYDAVLAASFEIHPYRNNTIGYLSDVQAVTRDQAYAFYRRYYHPNNAVLVVVGDVEAAAARRAIRARFDTLRAARRVHGGGHRRAAADRPAPGHRQQARTARGGDRRLPRARPDRSRLRGDGRLRRAVRGRQGAALHRRVPGAGGHAPRPRGGGLRGGDAGRDRLAGLALPLRLHRHRGRSRGAEGAGRPRRGRARGLCRPRRRRDGAPGPPRR